MRLPQVVVAGLLVLLTSGCASSPPAVARSSPPVHVMAGGCAGTVLTDAVPPSWAQGGWSHTPGTPWPVPWGLSSPGDAVAFVFAMQLVAGPSPRANGTANKVLWVARDPAGAYTVEARPQGQSQPLVTIQGGPSIVDLPSPGCWTFTIHSRTTSTINLQVLPAGSLPSPA